MTADVTPIPGGPTPETELAEDPERRRRRRKALLLLLLLLLLSLLIGIVIWYLLFRQPITPIPPIPVSQVPTYSTSVYGVTRPIGVAVDPSGDRIYVTQGGAAAAGVVLDSGGGVVGGLTPPDDRGTDHQPVYAAMDPTNGDVYVSDRLAGTIYIYDHDGAFERELKLDVPRPGWQPMGLAFDRDGNLYVTDFSGPAQKVLEIDRSGKVVRTLGEAETFNFPNGVGLDKNGNAYVTDSNNGRLFVYGTAGDVIAKVGRGAGTANLGLPRGLAIDGNGRVFVVDATAQAVSVYRVATADSRTLEFLGAFGVPGISDGQFSFPNSVAIDGRGRVYVADTFNDRIQIWSY